MEAATLGTLLRHLIELLDGAVANAYRVKAPGYKPRFTPVMRTLIRDGPSSIKTIAANAGVSHSAISQTVAEMALKGLVALREGSDQREHIADLTPDGRHLIPILEAQWICTEGAARSIDADIGLPLADVLRLAIAALDSKSFAERIAEQQNAKENDE